MKLYESAFFEKKIVKEKIENLAEIYNVHFVKAEM
jgi:hypothetical protein